MPRPVTKGPPIQFRLPIDVHEDVEAKADGKELTIPEYLVQYITRASREGKR